MQGRMSRLASILAVLGISTLIAACAATNTPASLEGIKQVFHDPGFAVQGKTRKDQRWISETQETGIRVLGWKRPKPPASHGRLLTKLKATLKTSKPAAQVLPPPKPPVVAAPVPVAPINPPVLQTTPAPELTPLPKRHWWER